jgi:hypothetical protein
MFTKFNPKARVSLTLIGLGAMALFAVGCGDDDDGPMGVDPGMPSGDTPMIRVVHASSDAPAVDIYAAGNSTPLFTNVEFGATTPYLSVPAGAYDIQLRAAGASPSSAPVYSTGEIEIGEDDTITAVAAGLIGSGAEADRFRVLPLAESFEATAGQARVRIVHASADAPTVAIDVGNDGSAEIAALERFADTGEAGVALPAGSALQVGIWAGTPLARVTAFTTPELPADAELFVIATGLVANAARATDGFSLLAVGPTGSIGFVRQNPLVYALHASPDAPAVDIAVAGGGPTLVERLAFGELSAPIQVPPGSYQLDIQAAASGMTAATVTTPSLAAGESYLTVASGFLAPQSGEQGFQLLAYADAFELDTMSPLLRVVHGSPDAPAVDVGVVSGGSFEALAPFSNLSFSESSAADGTEVPAAMLRIGVAATGTSTTAAEFDVTTMMGQKAFAVAAGALAPDAGQQGFRLIAIDTAATPWMAAEIMP